jgi:hypothetical protein
MSVLPKFPSADQGQV